MQESSWHDPDLGFQRLLVLQQLGALTSLSTQLPQLLLGNLWGTVTA
jgi:hypothetical protein